MKVVDGLVDVSVNAVSEATSELNEDSIVRDGRYIRGCNMMVFAGRCIGVMAEDVVELELQTPQIALASLGRRYFDTVSTAMNEIYLNFSRTVLQVSH